MIVKLLASAREVLLSVGSMLMGGERKTEKRVCPYCESAMVCRSRRHGVTEALLHLLSIVPFRCEECGERFFAWARKGNKQIKVPI